MDRAKKEKQMQEFKASLKELTLEQLREKEQEIIKKADENDKRIAEIKIDLPKENYKVVAGAIQNFLNKETVTWQYTLGLVTLYEYWNPGEFPGTITYPVLDATLRTLGELKFTGYSEWAAVVAVNKYFESLHAKYEELTESIYDIAGEHSAVMTEMDLRTPVKEEKPEA